MADLYPIKITVNGRSHQCSVQPRTHLVDFLREDLGLKGSHLGCEHGVSGACTVELNGLICASAAVWVCCCCACSVACALTSCAAAGITANASNAAKIAGIPILLVFIFLRGI